MNTFFTRKGVFLLILFSAFFLSAQEIQTSTQVWKDIPKGLDQGINYNEDETRATLLLFAPGKETVHVIGSFNDWEKVDTYLMNRDPVFTDFHWIELEGLNPKETYTFQYLTDDGIHTADPYSTLVLSPWDDPHISAAIYPNLPEYPSGQSFEVSVLQTGAKEYKWKINDFKKPAKEDLIIYELLIRDFNSKKTWNSLIEDFDYFKNLNINAIEILPIMEFEGNSSWGYTPVFHLAPDKIYGPADSMKAFIDLCHQNGIAVILDVALNHVFGRSPLVRMWMEDTHGIGFGPPSRDNPYVHSEPKHSYNVGYDLNHHSPATRYYVKRVIDHWIKEFKVDGFRWDLTKGFTNNCSEYDEACTNAYQSDRVAILKEYADYQWDADPDSYVIFEHLGIGGSHTEEMEWSRYKADEGKGIMVWSNWNAAFTQNMAGWEKGSNFNGMHHLKQGYAAPFHIIYAESHDDERVLYKIKNRGNSAGNYSVRNASSALERQKAFAAVFFSIPGPKMFWQFGELGYDFSINRCEDGSIHSRCRTSPKPVPEEPGWPADPQRLSVYTAWADIIALRMKNKVFKTKTYAIESGDLLPRIYIWDDSLPITELKNVVVFANFDVVPRVVTPYFPFKGNWVNLLDLSTLPVTSTGSGFQLLLRPGEYKIYGNTFPK